MKLRISKNSLRLRLSKSEVRIIGSGGTIEESVNFGGKSEQRLIYALVPVEEVEIPTAVFESGQITVFLPKSEANKWALTDRISMENAHSIENNEQALHILIEKDFDFLESRSGEKDSDAFANPSTGNSSNKIKLKALD